MYNTSSFYYNDLKKRRYIYIYAPFILIIEEMQYHVAVTN